MGKRLNSDSSAYTWAHRNEIPVFSPVITDGGVGDGLFLHQYIQKGIVLDTAADIDKLYSIARNSSKLGIICLGGGMSKHHGLKACAAAGGADFAAFLNTGHEFDGGDSGSSPTEPITWNAIKPEANPVKLFAESSLIFPLVVYKTFLPRIR
mmetsp:Transcript_30647/g.5521  ORF Transcript_30647/g.5521 Transcript_30647/m.5521 type:complete len:152 (-) Transcript_30647:35-490(-)